MRILLIVISVVIISCDDNDKTNEINELNLKIDSLKFELYGKNSENEGLYRMLKSRKKRLYNKEDFSFLIRSNSPIKKGESLTVEAFVVLDSDSLSLRGVHGEIDEFVKQEYTSITNDTIYDKNMPKLSSVSDTFYSDPRAHISSIPFRIATENSIIGENEISFHLFCDLSKNERLEAVVIYEYVVFDKE